MHAVGGAANVGGESPALASLALPPHLDANLSVQSGIKEQKASFSSISFFKKLIKFAERRKASFLSRILKRLRDLFLKMAGACVSRLRVCIRKQVKEKREK